MTTSGGDTLQTKVVFSHSDKLGGTKKLTISVFIGAGTKFQFDCQKSFYGIQYFMAYNISKFILIILNIFVTFVSR
jgi:hypothetical protein